MQKIDSGDVGWLILAGYVIAFDAQAFRYNRTTLSASFATAIASPRRRWPTVALWVYLTVHLHGLLPPKFDPLRRI
jgi:hypothetical protein